MTFGCTFRAAATTAARVAAAAAPNPPPVPTPSPTAPNNKPSLDTQVARSRVRPFEEWGLHVGSSYACDHSHAAHWQPNYHAPEAPASGARPHSQRGAQSTTSDGRTS